jgi:hypothetical protein
MHTSFVWLLVALVTLLVFRGFQTIRGNLEVKRTEQQWKDMTKKCTHEEGKMSQASIFVVILCLSTSSEDIDLVSNTIASLFENATCPMHLSIGAYEVVEDFRSESSLLSKLHAKWDTRASKLRRTFGDRVRIVKVPKKRVHAPDYARGFVMRQAYAGEAFVCTVAPGLVLRQGWDWDMLDARRWAANPFAIIVSPACLPQIEADDHTQDSMLSRSFAHSPQQWGDFLGSLGSQFANSGMKKRTLSSPTSCTASFLVAEGLDKHTSVPIVSARNFAREKDSSNAPLASLFWTSELSLAPASALVDVVDVHNNPRNSTDSVGLGLARASPFGSFLTHAFQDSRVSDYATGLRFWISGWDFYTPNVSLASWESRSAYRKYIHSPNQQSLQTNPSETWLTSIYKMGPRSVGEFIQFSATDPSGKLYPRARLGVTKGATTRELSSKYGSQSGFEAEREALLMELTDT